MMHTNPYIFCYRCHSVVKPVLTLSSYSCPACGAAIAAERVEATETHSASDADDMKRGVLGGSAANLPVGDCRATSA